MRMKRNGMRNKKWSFITVQKVNKLVWTTGRVLKPGEQNNRKNAVNTITGNNQKLFL